MAEDNRILRNLTTRVRQLILQHHKLKEENEGLCRKLAERDAEIQQLTAKLRQAERDYESLKVSRMISITDGDVARAKSRLRTLIKDVNKCISLLNNNE